MGNIGSAVLVCLSIAENLQNRGDGRQWPEKAPYHGNESAVILSDHDCYYLTPCKSTHTC